MGRHACGEQGRDQDPAARRPSAATHVRHAGVADVVPLPIGRRRKMANSLAQAWTRLRQEASAEELPPRSPALPPSTHERRAHPAFGSDLAPRLVPRHPEPDDAA